MDEFVPQWYFKAKMFTRMTWLKKYPKIFEMNQPVSKKGKTNKCRFKKPARKKCRVEVNPSRSDANSAKARNLKPEHGRDSDEDTDCSSRSSDSCSDSDDDSDDDDDEAVCIVCIVLR